MPVELESRPVDRLSSQLTFLQEIDKLKQVQRQTLLLDGSRCENDAEHSWQLAVMAMVLAEYANEPELKVSRVVQMLLVHDLVEIDAGDTYAYDSSALQDQAQRESQAADRLFGLLPEDQRLQFRELWDEFEEQVTAEAQFARALDRFQPLMHNCLTGGIQWRRHGVNKARVIERCSPMAKGSTTLWKLMAEWIDRAAEAGHLPYGTAQSQD